MQFIMFSKMLREKDVDGLIEFGRTVGLDGYDLAVRPGYVVNPDNVEDALPEVVAALRSAGIDVPMLTGNFDLLSPEHPTAEPILRAMKAADVRLLKLGYYKFNPYEQRYWTVVERVRRDFEGWQELAEKYDVCVCYHTHSDRCMGLNAAALCHLIRGFDSSRIGAYIDTGHLIAEGEEFPVAVAMVRKQLRIVAMKDMLITRGERYRHGTKQHHVVPAGQGMVDWTAVFDTLRLIHYDGPVSVHCEFRFETPEEFQNLAQREVAFLREMARYVADRRFS